MSCHYLSLSRRERDRAQFLLFVTHIVGRNILTYGRVSCENNAFEPKKK